ncbi:MAG: hypothetical protein ABIJ09_12020, partial [Pseudomonadota bacterium]
SKDWLLAGQVLAPPSVDETGDMWSALTSVFTGTLANGTTSSNCSDWSTSAGVTTVGSMTGGTQSWTDNMDGNCVDPAHLYCFGNLGTADQVLAPSTANKRLAFITASFFVPGSGGITAADDFCNTEAAATGNYSTFKALLATESTSAISRLTPGQDWVRPDGVTVLDGTLAATGPGLLAPLNVTLWLNYLDKSAKAWTGADLLNVALAAESCGNWSSASGSGRVGRPNLAGAESTFAFTRACTTADIMLYCLEE